MIPLRTIDWCDLLMFHNSARFGEIEDYDINLLSEIIKLKSDLMVMMS